MGCAPLLGEGNRLPCLRGGCNEPARVGDRLKDNGGAFIIAVKEEALLSFGLIVEIHDIFFLRVRKGLVRGDFGEEEAKLTQSWHGPLSPTRGTAVRDIGR